jgi:hypothetical protein
LIRRSFEPPPEVPPDPNRRLSVVVTLYVASVEGVYATGARVLASCEGSAIEAASVGGIDVPIGAAVVTGAVVVTVETAVVVVDTRVVV